MNDYDPDNYKDILHSMNDFQRRQYALVIAERALNIFEKILPSDTRPRTMYELAVRYFSEDKPIPKNKWSTIYSSVQEIQEIYRDSSAAKTAARTVFYLGLLEDTLWLVIESSSVCLATVFNSTFSRYDNVQDLRDEFNTWLYKEALKIMAES